MQVSNTTNIRYDKRI